MSQVCQVTGKRPSTGHKVSHSNRKTKRRFNPNLFKRKVRIFDSKLGKFVVKKMLVSAKGLRTLRKRFK